MRRGYAADFAVLDKNIFEIDPREIRRTRALLTVMGGQVTYQAAEWKRAEAGGAAGSRP